MWWSVICWFFCVFVCFFICTSKQEWKNEKNGHFCLLMDTKVLLNWTVSNGKRNRIYTEVSRAVEPSVGLRTHFVAGFFLLHWYLEGRMWFQGVFWFCFYCLTTLKRTFFKNGEVVPCLWVPGESWKKLGLKAGNGKASVATGVLQRWFRNWTYQKNIGQSGGWTQQAAERHTGNT